MYRPLSDKLTIKERAAKLRQKGFEKLNQHIVKKVGEKDLILIEKNTKEKSIGKDQNFLHAMIDENIKEGDIVPCIYIGVHNNMLIAKRI